MKRKIALITVLLLIVPALVFAQYGTERVYEWYKEEKITVSSTVLTLTANIYDYDHCTTRIAVDDPNGGASGTVINPTDFSQNTYVKGGTSGAFGLLEDYDDANNPNWLEINIYYGTFSDNEVIVADSNGSVQANIASGYTPCNESSNALVTPQIAEIHVLDNSILWTRNGNRPVYSSTDSVCIGRKAYEGDTFYLFGSGDIKKFQCLRNGTSDAVIYVRYGL